MNRLGRRVVVTALGETPLESIDEHLILEDQPPPDPATLGATDVVVAVRSASVGWVDLLMTSGQYQQLITPPYTPGLEYSGEVVWVGKEVTRFCVGDAVIADPLYTGPRSPGAYAKWGGFASYALAPMYGLLPLPKAFDFDRGCNFLGNYETAYHCLIHRGRLAKDETVLIHGASGSVGLAAVHLAKLAGAKVIATGRSAEKLAVVSAQGADHVIDTTQGALRERIKELTAGRGVDVVYDGVGGDISLESLRCVTFGARYLIVGWAATPFVAKGKGGRGAPNANLLPTNLIMMKGLDVLGCPTTISTQKDPSIREARLGALLRWVEAGRLVPYVSRVFAFADVKEAMKQKWESRFVGGCVIHP